MAKRIPDVPQAANPNPLLSRSSTHRNIASAAFAQAASEAFFPARVAACNAWAARLILTARTHRSRRLHAADWWVPDFPILGQTARGVGALRCMMQFHHVRCP